MGRGLDNYFLILELDFTKPESDTKLINDRIKEKAKFWNANSDKGKMQQKYRQYKSQVMDIGKVMTTDSLRAVEAKDAMSFVQGILKEELTFFSGEKEIEESAANAIMERAGIWPEVFEKLSGLKIVKTVVSTAEEVSDPNPKPDKIVKFKKYETDLKVVNKENLYDFLADQATTDIIGLQTLDGNELIATYSNPLKERVKYEKTEEATSTRTLCAACEEVFDPKNKSLRDNYDKYLIWQKKDVVISLMVKYAGSAKKLSTEQKRLFTDRMTQIVRNRDEAVRVIEQICKFKDISSGAPIAPEKGKVVCGHCYTMVDTSHGEKKCSNCGSDLYIKCPKCGKEVLASLQACGYCGFKLDDIQKVETMCKIAQAAILNMDFILARSNIAKAEHLLSGYSKISSLKAELTKKEGIFSKEVLQLNELVKKKEFYKAIDILHELQNKVPTAKIPNELLIESSVRQAENLYKNAVTEKSEEKLIQICSEISGICSDYPGIETLMLKYRPKPVSDIRILCDTKSGTNVITWNPSPSPGELSYKILRKENTASASIKDPAAEELGVAGVPRFVDVSPNSGVTYYYTVYTFRAGVASEPVYASAVNLADIIITKKEEGDGFVKMEWKPLNRNARVNVYRCEGRIPKMEGDGVRINATSNYFRDDLVKNDVQYGYLITVTYHVDGKDITTAGVSEMMIASSLPEPVDDLSVTSIDDEIFEAVWTQGESEKVILYYTDTRTSLKYGDVTEVSKVIGLLHPVDSISNTPGRCRFKLLGSKKYAIIPVTVKHSTAVIGEQAIAARIEKIKVEKIELVNSNLFINLKWPEDVVSILVIYGENGFSKSIEDRKGKNVRSISKNQFLADTGLIIRNIEKKDYYITLFSAYKVNGERMYSDGTQLRFSNKPKTDITFSIRVRGIFEKNVEVEFTSSEKEFVLPETDIIAKQGSVPVYATSGIVIEHIEEQTVSGNYKFTIPVSSLPKCSYLKPFFTDEKVYEYIDLRPVYGTRFKVN